MNTMQKLDQIADMQAQAEAIRLQYADMRNAWLTPEIRQALEDLDAQEKTATTNLQGAIDKLTAEVKDEVIKFGASVKGQFLHAVFSNRVSWDGKALDGYAAAHPEIVQFRKESQSVSIRGVK